MTNNQTKNFLIGRSPITFGRFTYGYENISVFQSGEGAALKIGAFCSIAPMVTIFLGSNHRTDWISTFPFGHIFQNELGEEKHQGTHPQMETSSLATMSGLERGHLSFPAYRLAAER